MVLFDEVNDGPGQAVLPGQGQAVLDVANDDQGAQGRLERIVPIFTGLVFDEILRLEHLAHVVEITPYAGQQGIGADGLGCGFRQRRHGHAVRVSSGGPANQFLQERMRAVAQFQQAHVGDDPKTSFHQRQDAGQNETGQTAPNKMPAGLG